MGQNRKPSALKRKKTHRVKPKRRGEEANSLEANLVELAVRGKIARAADEAVQAQREIGLPIVFQRGYKIVKQNADGTEEILGKVSRPNYGVPKNVAVFSKH